MRLSVLLERQYGRDVRTTDVNLSYTPIIELDRVPTRYHQIRCLILNHCELKNLKGIEQFVSLRTLSLKFNDLCDHAELQRLACRETLQQLNFLGNDIEHYQICRYESLRQWLPNLQQLNNIDYRFRKLVGDKNKMAIHRNVPTSRIMERLDMLPATTCRRRLQTEPEKQNLQTQMQPPTDLQDISLSRVEMVKSVVKPQEPQFRKKQLLISTVNNDNNIQVYQPTATFARQKAVVGQGTSFPFKSGLMELLQRRDDQELYNSGQGNMQPHFISCSNIMFPELQDEVDENKEDLAEAHYLRTLCRKMFDRLTWARQHMNMPRRKDFL